MDYIDTTIKSILFPTSDTNFNLENLINNPNANSYILRIADLTKKYDYQNKKVSILDFYSQEELFAQFKNDNNFAKILTQNYLKALNIPSLEEFHNKEDCYTYNNFFRTFLTNFHNYLNNMLNVDDSYIIMYDLLKRNFDFNGFIVDYYKRMENYLFLKKKLFSLIIADGYTYANYKFYNNGSITYLRALDKTRKFINNNQSLSNSEKALLLKYTILLNQIRITNKREINEIQDKIKLDLKKINPLYHLD